MNGWRDGLEQEDHMRRGKKGYEKEFEKRHLKLKSIEGVIWKLSTVDAS